MITDLNDGEEKSGKICSNDASSDRFSLSFTGSSWSVGGVTFAEKKSDSALNHNALLHWETVLVVTTSNSEDVSLVLISHRVAWNLVAQFFVVENGTVAGHK